MPEQNIQINLSSSIIKSEISLAISVFERWDLLNQMLLSLKQVIGIDDKKVNVHVFDDKSHNFNRDKFLSVFPFVSRFITQQTNLGADGQMHYIMKDFIAGKGKYLIFIDSDLIFNENFLVLLSSWIESTDGILSGYNSFNHPTINSISEDIIEKQSIGGAATMFSRSIIELINNNVPFKRRLIVKNGYDVAWSHFLRLKGYRLLAVKRSLSQHAGFIYGQNNKLSSVNKRGSFEYGQMFDATNSSDMKVELANQQLINSYLLSKKKYGIKKLIRYLLINTVKFKKFLQRIVLSFEFRRKIKNQKR